MINKITEQSNNNGPRQTRSLTKASPTSKRSRESELIYLSKVTAFSQLKNYQIDYIYRSIKSVEFTRGHLIFQEGQKCDAVYVIKQGEIEIFKKEPINQQIEQYYQLNKKKFVHQMIKVLGEQTAFGVGDIVTGIYSINARVSSHFAELYMIKVQDYKRILDMEPQIKLLQQESENMDNLEVIPKFQLPSLYDSVKASQAQKQEIQYLRKVRKGITYLIPQAQGTDVMKNSHMDQSLEEIYKKSVILHQKMLPNYQQVDLENPLIQGQEIINDRLLLNKIIQKEYTIRFTKESPRTNKMMQQSVISTSNSPMSKKLQLIFQKDKKVKQNQTVNEVSHREKMKIIQDTSPHSSSFRSARLDTGRSTFHATPIFDQHDPIRLKQFIPTELFPIYCHLIKPDNQEIS
ncbi:unnamed protein product (macronuclear) [Paramecium tetraurelia]|uniref:Cyclic nucleotide-binding domain-containing protein n=1 Tax=Paramecium tetraurelia TaxID=5888 RepID=A0DM36_PARTE|nr:uncharacterized protein GSPATT00018321001 [Paramecium tetraurelia]CAK84103.1 unnamed protein product [Paramecium tetraurelia]|eukprot:XP_001451500.1 hypothetical protein (macronuclear) [Paramecium tetraurelia strain d4-2]